MDPVYLLGALDGLTRVGLNGEAEDVQVRVTLGCRLLCRVPDQLFRDRAKRRVIQSPLPERRD